MSGREGNGATEQVPGPLPVDSKWVRLQARCRALAGAYKMFVERDATVGCRPCARFLASWAPTTEARLPSLFPNCHNHRSINRTWRVQTEYL